MVAPRYRLMVLLYLRGLLKPDYPQGNRSIAREDLLLQAVSAETTATAQLAEINLQAAFASLFNPKSAPSMLDKLSSAVNRLTAMSTLDFVAARQVARKAAGSVESMAKLYDALVKGGIIVEN